MLSLTQVVFILQGMQLVFLSQIKIIYFWFGTVSKYYSVVMLLAGKYFVVGCIKSPVLQWDINTEEFRWLEWSFDEPLGVEDAYFCHLLWKYMVILSTSSSWTLHLSLCRMTLGIFFPCAGGIEQLLPHRPSRWQFPCPARCAAGDPASFDCILQPWPWLLIFILFLEGSMFVYHILHFVCVCLRGILVQLCKCSFCTEKLWEMRASESCLWKLWKITKATDF